MAKFMHSKWVLDYLDSSSVSNQVTVGACK